LTQGAGGPVDCFVAEGVYSNEGRRDVGGAYKAFARGDWRTKKATIIRRIIVTASSFIALIGLGWTMEGAAWGATSSSSSATIIFDDAAQQAELIIPTPPCPVSQPNCEWKFFLNEPKLSVDVGTVYGTSGTLTIAYPKDFCGVIQADAYVGPPWVAKRGFQHTIEDCNTPPTTAPPATTPTTAPPSTTPTTAPPVVAATSTPPAAPPAAAPTIVPVSAAPAELPSTGPAALPFTGVNVKPLLYVGLALVMLGLYLLAPAESWRKLSRFRRKLARLRSTRPLLGRSSFNAELIRGMAEIHPRPATSTTGCAPPLALNRGIENLSQRGPISEHWPRRLTGRSQKASAHPPLFHSSAIWPSQRPPIRGP
jgi:hypothetical protein